MISYLFNIPAEKNFLLDILRAVAVTGHCIIQFSPIPRRDAQVHTRLLPTCSEMLLNGFEKFTVVDRVSRFIYFFIIHLLLFILQMLLFF